MKTNLPKIGMRNIKTALSVLACLLLYRGLALFIGALPSDGNAIYRFFYQLLSHSHVLYACVGAIISMQSTVDSSLQQGRIRLLGTVIGGAMGILFLYFDRLLWNGVLTLAFAPLGIVLLIYLCNLISMRDSVSIACVVFLIILLDLSNTIPYVYAISRILDTAIGIVIAVAINLLIDRPKHSHHHGKGGGTSPQDSPEEEKDHA